MHQENNYKYLVGQLLAWIYTGCRFTKKNIHYSILGTKFLGTKFIMTLQYLGYQFRMTLQYLSYQI